MRKYLVPRYILKVLKLIDPGYHKVTEAMIVRRIRRVNVPLSASNNEILVETFWKFNTVLKRSQFVNKIAGIVSDWNK